MKVKVLTAKAAVEMITDKATIATGGFVGSAVPEELNKALGERFVSEGKPENLTLVFAAGQGDGKDKGLNYLGHEGLLKKVIGGHWGLIPKVQALALENKIEGYNLPQGVISHMFRDIAAKKPATITHVGLKTFVDPRLEGGKVNSVTKKDIVEVIKLDGKEYLKYNTFPIDFAFLRGTYADENGNISSEHEAISGENLSIAAACKNSGGKVIVQVKEIVKVGKLDPKLVKIPGIYVDSVVVCDNEENHMQTYLESLNLSYCQSPELVNCADVPNHPENVNSDAYQDNLDGQPTVKPMPLDIRKIIARRAAMELIPDAIVNLGIGVPEGVAAVASEEGQGDKMVLTVESGPIGGVPAGGLSFGASAHPEAILDQPYQFDFYDGGGLDLAFLGLAQCDKGGNINVSKFGPKIAGCGGFINITQNAKKVVYCGSFTAGGLKVKADNGNLVILSEGKVKKFLNKVEQITFSGEYALDKRQPILYITERAVFELSKEGLVLTEIAPGVDLQKDVLDLIEFDPIISGNLKKMDAKIFKDELMNLNI